MERFYIVRHDGTLNIIYEGGYCEALDFAAELFAELFEIPDGEPVSEYADVLTEEEFEAEYGE